MPTRDIKRIPRPDYASHPAYGAFFGTPTIRERLSALKQVAPHLYDSWREYRLWKNNLARFRRAGVVKKTERLEQFTEDGAIALPLTAEELSTVRKMAEPWIEKLNAGRAQKAKRVFQDNSLKVNDEALRAYLTKVFAKHGHLELASSYMKMPLRINNLFAIIFGTEDTSFWKKTFEGTGIASPGGTSYMHIDSRFGTIKFLLYLNDVTEENGPFCFVRGSHHFKRSPAELIIRKAMDKSRLDSIGLEKRKVFWCLPSYLQKKAAFGYDLTEGSAEAQALLAREKRFLSAEGNLILFDYNGIHRGGMVRSGERRLLQIQLVPDEKGNA